MHKMIIKNALIKWPFLICLFSVLKAVSLLWVVNWSLSLWNILPMCMQVTVNDNSVSPGIRHWLTATADLVVCVAIHRCCDHNPLWPGYDLRACQDRKVSLYCLAVIQPVPRDHAVYGINRWETTLHCKVAYHWLRRDAWWYLECVNSPGNR